MPWTFTTPTMTGGVAGTPHPDNPWVAAEFIFNVSSITYASGSAIAAVDGNPSTIAAGESITVAGSSVSGYNGTFTVASTTSSLVTWASSNYGSATGGTLTRGSEIYTRPSLLTDTRRWDVFSGDLGFPYDGKDGKIYCFLGDTFGHNWSGPNTTATRLGNTTVAAGSNGVALSSLVGSQNISLAAAGNFTTTGGVAAVQLASNGSALAYIKYNSRTSTTLSGCTLIYAPDSTKTLTTGDTIRGDDGWTNAGWRSNTLFVSSDTDLSNGMTIDTFQNVQSPQGFAKQAIPGAHSSEVTTNVFPASKTISSVSATATSATITFATTHPFIAGQPITVSGTTNAAYHGQFTVTSVVSGTKISYALTGSPASATGGTCAPTTTITNISCSDTVTVSCTTSVAHGLSVGQGFKTSGTGVRDGEYIVATVGSATSFTFYAYGGNATATVGTFQPAANYWGSTSNPNGGVQEGTVIPTGAIALEGQSAGVAPTTASWAASVATITCASNPCVSVGEQIVVSGITPSGYNGTFTATAVSGASVSYALNSNPGAYTSGGTVKWTRHYAYYMSIAWFSTLSGQWYSNYMGIAWSDDKGNTWTRPGVSGANYQTVTAASVWPQNTQWTSHFQQAWPVDGGDGYVYILATGNGRFDNAYLGRVLKANILDPSQYTYWNGSTWTSTITAATSIYTGPQAEPTLYYHVGSAQWISVYLKQDQVFGNSTVIRTASSLTGPWSSESVLLANSAFGAQDVYGGWIHPWSNTSPQSSTDFYFMVSLFSPYMTFLLRSIGSPSKNPGFFRLFR